ncbi:uncharacterized protein LOC133780196 [Humulus lupulus]|uniref:uncharacterized protein LOC133780196 n=1 Tax=Humulus lupulus TaxID=3486 RepID=UPI002B4126AC|nr:uncharacterized protein LOC133780196 [Humulus lupulus]
MALPQVMAPPQYEILPYNIPVRIESDTPIFLIHLFVKFTRPFRPEDSVTFTNVGLLSHEKLTENDNTNAKVAIDNLLAEVNAPSSLFFLTNEIINYGLKMWNDKDHNLSIKVDVDVFVDELPPTSNDDSNDNDEDHAYDMDDVPINFVAASEKSIEKLEKVQIKDDQVSCSICLENMSVGLEATRLFCGHRYHEECIVEWLQISKFCPLCRDELA